MLNDLLVIDLTRHLPGPWATALLAAHGARVIKVEQPPLGDPVRALPPHDADGVAAIYAALNRGKRSLALDLKQPAAQDVLRRLVARADVLVEGFRPGVLARLGLDPDELARSHPSLVVCSLSGYGQDGPYRDKAGHDIDYQAYSGALGLTVDAQGHPVTPGLQAGDLLAGLSALSGILLALLERARTGRGRRVDVGILDALVSAQALHLIPHLAGAKAEPGRMPLSGAVPGYGVYRAGCGRSLALGILEPKFWETFCDLVSRPDWLERQFDPALRPELEALFLSRSRDEWRVILENADCCLAPVLSYDEVLEDPQVVARGLVRGDHLAPPMRFVPPGDVGSEHLAARAGADTRAVLSEVLGLTPAEVEGLLAGGAARA